MDDKLRLIGAAAWALLGIIGVAAVALFVIWRVRVIFPPLLIAATIVFLLNPVVHRLAQRGVPRVAAAALTYLAVVLVGGLTVLAFTPLVGGQVEQLQEDFPEIRQRVEDWVDDRARESEVEDWPIKVPRWDKLIDELSPPERDLREQVTRLREFGSTVLHITLIVVLSPIIAFYLLVDLPHTADVIQSLIPPNLRDEVNLVGRKLSHALGAYFRGQLAVALIVGILCSIGLSIIGLKFAFIVGMIAGLFNVVPLIGPWIGGVPGVIIALTTGTPVKALLVVAVMAGVQQIDNHFITPQVMQRAVALHPSAVMLALLAGGTMAGFLGLLLAVPVTAALRIVGSHVWRHHVLGEALPRAVTIRLPRRACAVALILTGLWFGALVPFHPNILRDDVADAVLNGSGWQVIHVAMYIVGLAGVLAACGVVAAHDDRLGRAGQIALAVTVLGAVVTAGTGMLEAAVFPEVARRAPDLVDFDGPIFTDSLFRALSGPWMLFPAGFIALGVLAYRDGAFRRAGAALAASALGFMVFGLWFAPVIGQISDIAFGAVLVWWGALVWSPVTRRD